MRSKGGDRDEKKILRGLAPLIFSATVRSQFSLFPSISFLGFDQILLLWYNFPSFASDRPFQPKGYSDLGGEESALQIALNQSQRQTQWFTEVNPEGKVSVTEDKLFVFRKMRRQKEVQGDAFSFHF
ncbi:uncharacterized protein LOC103956189 [Pyrus x bretschneideri]|uniref:uncharacterized protein LOC103956189 n=1 Tax=Pyrus x bretschneideri TaxID=225117 RepID=UPI00202EF18B|nr:uncharacterized protein LOC103956189 [Pyrus x bretschneideri]